VHLVSGTHWAELERRLARLTAALIDVVDLVVDAALREQQQPVHKIAAAGGH
jgi:hypothetical protein